MRIFDSHVHIFSEKVIRNVQQKEQMAQRLKLQTAGAEKRCSLDMLKSEIATAGVDGALVLPTAGAAGVQKTNRECIRVVSAAHAMHTAGTLHPDFPHIPEELDFLRRHDVRIVKMCTFSQGFVLDGPSAIRMFDAIQLSNENTDKPLAVVLDTFCSADRYFGTRPEYNTTPQRLAGLVEKYPGINFIGAHMGGLDAPGDVLRRHLTARSNLYLDTSNAAHVLSTRDFCDLVAHHGPDKIIFGTDWPWFTHGDEVPLIHGLLDKAGFNEAEKSMVFRTNILKLLE